MRNNFKLLILLLVFTYSTSSFADDKIKDVLNIKKSEDKKKETFRLSLEGGITLINGNSKSESYYGDVKTQYDFNEKWKDILQGRAENKSENDIRSKEYYRVNNQTRYSVSKLNYALLELEYVDDRFGGYDYRLSETLGFGREIYKSKDINFSSQVGIGYRQLKLSNGEKSNVFTARTALNFNWQIVKSIYFSEHLDISADHEATITRSEANLKVHVNSSLYLKFLYLIEHKSSVPQDIKNTDSTTMVILGYEL